MTLKSAHCFRVLSLCWIVSLGIIREVQSNQVTEEGTATFVTALYDIGRESLPTFPRPFHIYLERLKHLLALDVNLVIFGATTLRSFVGQHRKGRLEFRTKFIPKPFSHLPMYRHAFRIQCIFESEDFWRHNEKLTHPEAYSFRYITVVNSKAALVGEVAYKNPFNTSHFFWIDAGYVAVDGDVNPDVIKVNIPAGTRWVPKPLLRFSNQVTFIQLHDPGLFANITHLHKRSVASAFVGGFFGGGREVVMYYEKLFNKWFLYQLAEGEVREDQGTALQVYFEHPGLFHLVQGDWFDAYRLFH